MSDPNIPGQDGEDSEENLFSWREDLERLSPDARVLQHSLTIFAEQNTREREVNLFGLVNHIRAIADASASILEELTDPAKNPNLINNDFRPQLNHAIRTTLDTPLRADKHVVNVWDESFTVVLLGRGGQILAAEADPHKRIFYRRSKDQSFSSALVRAVFRMHLELQGRNYGLENEDNYEYLAGLGLRPGRDLSLGESATSDGSLIVGTSECGLNQAYIDTLLPASMRNRWFGTGDFLASYADMYFARGVARSLQSPKIGPEPMPEPILFSELRRAH